MNTKDLFVSYSLNKQLQEKGFNEHCFGVIYPDGEILFSSPDLTTIMSRKEKNCIKAAMHQQVLDWFREKHDIHIELELEDNSKIYNYSICIKDSRIKNREYHDNDMLDQAKPIFVKYKTSVYYEALNKAIEEALKLI